MVFAFEEEAADFGQGEVGVGAVGVLRRSGPHAGFVEHDAFLGDTAVERCAEAAVTERDGFKELFAGVG